MSGGVEPPVEVTDPSPPSIVNAAVRVARSLVNVDGGMYVSNISYGSEIDPGGGPVVLSVGQERDWQVVVRVALPEGDVIGHVTIYLAADGPNH